MGRLESASVEQSTRLQESEAKLRAMVEATPHMVWSSTAEGRGDYFNAQMLAFTGKRHEDLAGSAWAELVDPQDRERVLQIWTRCLEQGTPLSIEFRFRHHSGQYRWVLGKGAPVLDAEGRISRWMGTNTDIHEQKTAHARLQESEQRFRSLVHATSQAVWYADADGCVLPDSLSSRAVTGLSEEEGRNADWVKLLHPDDRQRAVEGWRRACLEGSYYENELRIRHVDGHYRWISVRAVPVRHEDGSVREWIGTHTDITEQKETELALREARRRVQGILNSADIGTWVYDLSTNLVHGDANATRLFGVPENPAGVDAEAYFGKLHPDDVPPARERVANAIGKGEPYQEIYRVRAADGGWRFLHLRGAVEFAEDGTPLSMQGVALDVTAQRLMEEQLGQREARYKALFDTIEEGFYIIELIYDKGGAVTDFRFIEANPAAGRLNGLHDVVGKTVREVFSEPTLSWLKIYDQVASTGRSTRFMDYSAGLGRWYDISVTRIGGAGSRQVALLFSDITESKHKEEELARMASDLAVANRRQGEFLAVLAHELCNPLAPIRSGLELIDLGTLPAERIREVHTIMRRQLDHLVHLVDELLDVARINSGKIELKCAHEHLQDIIKQAIDASRPALQERRHALVIDVETKPIWVFADRNRVAQILSNLLINASKYTPERGRIELRLRQENTMALIAVSDNGIGIAPEDHARLFEMFSQSGRGLAKSQGGLGIGLNLAKRLTEKHGGSLLAESAGVGRGSTFTVRLPVVGPRVPEDAAPVEAAEARAQQSGLRILLAEDNRDTSYVLQALLQASGNEVEVAHDGREALELALRRKPDLALLDLGMPEMTGFEVAQAIRQRSELSSVVLAALTGWGAAEDRERSRNAGFDFHLTKPVTIEALEELFSKVKTIMES